MQETATRNHTQTKTASRGYDAPPRLLEPGELDLERTRASEHNHLSAHRSAATSTMLSPQEVVHMLESENLRLQRIVVELMLKNQRLREGEALAHNAAANPAV